MAAQHPLRHLGDLTIDPAGRTVEIDDEEVQLTRIEFDLLEVLTSKPTMVFSRSLLRELVWGSAYGDDHVVDVHIANLRKKIDPAAGPSRVRTVRGVGYRMAGHAPPAPGAGCSGACCSARSW